MIIFYISLKYGFKINHTNFVSISDKLNVKFIKFKLNYGSVWHN
jgi:hypothetical protein